MKKNYVAFCFAAALPFVANMAFAQATPAPAPAPSDAGNYSLTIPVAPAAQVTPKDYEIKSTTISGSKGATNTILTAPVGTAAPIKTESGVYFYPSVFVGAGYNDNLQSSNSNPVGSSFTNLAPQVIAELKHGGDRYTALATINNVTYGSSSGDNFTNSEITLAGDNYFTARARGGWSLGQVRGTDPRGSNGRPVSADADRWTANNVDGRFIYGAPEAQGRLEFDADNQNKSYDNNRINTAIADLSLTSYAARAFVRLGSRSLALAEYRNAKANYLSADSTASNTERRYYVGLTWDATAATTGIFKLGRVTKDFDTAGINAYSGDSWEGSMRWAPLTYSVFDLQTTRGTADSTGLGNYSVNTNTNIIWNHKWSPFISTRAAMGIAKTDYSGIARSDSANNYALTADYSVLRWLKVGVDWAGTDSSSSVPTASFKRNITMLTLNASL